MVANSGERVAEFASLGNGIVHAVRGEQREIEGTGEINGDAVAGFLFALEVALEFDVDIFLPKDADEFVKLVACFVDSASCESSGERSLVAACEADQAVRVLFKFFAQNRAFPLLARAQLHFGDQAAEILIARAGGDEERKAERIFSFFVIPSEARNLYSLHGFWW